MQKHAWILAALSAIGCSTEKLDWRSRGDGAAAPESLQIRNGSDDSSGAYHSVVELKIDLGDGTQTCTGSIVGPSLVLTAAHCFHGKKDPTVTLTAANRIRTKNSTGKVVSGSRLVVHPAYVNLPVSLPGSDGLPIPANAPDFALVKFSEDLGYARPFELATTIPAPDHVPVTIVGWGANELEQMNSRRVGRAYLDGVTPSLKGVSGDRIFFHKIDGMLLVSPGDSGQITCPGDSGGPLLGADRRILGVLSVGASGDDSCKSTIRVSYGSVVAERDELAKMFAALADPAPSRAWQNPANRFDVTNDGRVSARDVLMVIADISARGARGLPQVKGPNDDFVDVSGDGRLTAHDALLVLENLSALIGVRAQSVTTQSGMSLAIVSYDDSAPYVGVFQTWHDPAHANRWKEFRYASANEGSARRYLSNGTGRSGARWTMRLDPGTYQLQASFPGLPENAPKVTYDVKFSDGRAAQRVQLDQTKTTGAEAEEGVQWHALGAKIVVTKAVDVSVFVTDLNAKVGARIFADGLRAKQE